MRRIEYGRSLGEALRGDRTGLLNRGSGVRISAPAPNDQSAGPSEPSRPWMIQESWITSATRI
jgi:hypothetical protein